MTCFLFCRSQKAAPKTARKVGSILVLDLTSACRPIVWQYDLDHAGRAGFEVEEARAGIFTLRLLIPDLAPQLIAEFNDRADALAALTDIQEALATGNGHGRCSAHPAPSKGHMVIMALSAFVLLVVLSLLFFSLMPPPTDSAGPSFAAQKEVAPMPAPSSAPNTDQSAMPQNADDFLKD